MSAWLLQQRLGTQTILDRGGRQGRARHIAVEQVPPERVHMYGVVGIGESRGDSFCSHQDGGEAVARERDGFLWKSRLVG
jgi:hypothetical protein